VPVWAHHIMSDGVFVWTLELCALPVDVWSPLSETAQLSIYMGVCVYIYIYSRAVNERPRSGTSLSRPHTL